MIQTQRTRPLEPERAGVGRLKEPLFYNIFSPDQQAEWLKKLKSVGMAVTGLILAPAHRQAGERAVSHLNERRADHDPV